MTPNELDDVFRKAARSALVEWGREATDDDVQDLAQELWLWYLANPSVRGEMDGAPSVFFRRRLAKNHAMQLLSKQQLSSNVFQGRCLYSSEAVKDALKERSTNRYLVDVLPLALKALDERNEAYAESIRSRYEDGRVPAQGAAAQLLTDAHKALTEEVNITAITAGVDADGNAKSGPGSRHAVFPEVIKRKGAHGDPVGELAVSLLNADQETRDHVFETLPIELLLKGRHAQPVRWDLERNARVRDVPGSTVPGAVAPREADAG